MLLVVLCYLKKLTKIKIQKYNDSFSTFNKHSPNAPLILWEKKRAKLLVLVYMIV